jgi:hypothetical protein
MAALVTLLVALVLSAGVSAGKMSLTVWPLSGIGLNALMFAEATPMSTEVGFRVTDRLELVADVFVWGVCLDVEGDVRLPDNCFDLLPGIPYEIVWSDGLGEARVVRVGSRDAVSPPQ